MSLFKKVIGLLLIYAAPLLLVKGCYMACNDAVDLFAGWTLIPMIMVGLGLYLTEGSFLP